MSAAGGVPVPAEFGQARAAVDRHLGQRPGRPDPGVGRLGAARPADPVRPAAGFTSRRPRVAYGFDPSEPAAGGERPFAGAPAGDDYLLRLYFSHYPDWPPSARFVNPATRQFGAGDKRWLPMITGANELHVHASYGSHRRAAHLLLGDPGVLPGQPPG